MLHIYIYIYDIGRLRVNLMDRFEQLLNCQFLKDECSPEVRLDVTVLLFWLLFFFMVYCVHLISECVASKRECSAKNCKERGSGPV